MKLAILFTVNCLLLLISHTRGNFVSAFNLAENAQNRELKIDLYEIAPNKTVYVIDKLNKFSFENGNNKKTVFRYSLIFHLNKTLFF